MDDLALRVLFEDEYDKPDSCERIDELCREIQQITTEHRERFWNLIRMPITPATILSITMTVAAWLEAVKQEWAFGATAMSAAFGYCKVKKYLEQRTDFYQTRKMILGQIRSLLPHIHERDILPVRALIDEFPEIKEECSDF